MLAARAHRMAGIRFWSITVVVVCPFPEVLEQDCAIRRAVTCPELHACAAVGAEIELAVEDSELVLHDTTIATHTLIGNPS